LDKTGVFISNYDRYCDVTGVLSTPKNDRATIAHFYLVFPDKTTDSEKWQNVLAFVHFLQI